MIAAARWAAARGGRWESWVGLRIGELLFMETLGAFVIGAAVGGFLAAEIGASAAPGPRRIGPPGRGAFDPSALPFAFGVGAAIIDVLVRVDVAGLLFRGRSPHGTLATYIGSETRVVVSIPAGGYGEISLTDGVGNRTSVAATADVDIPAGTRVRITGARGANPLVAPISSTSRSDTTMTSHTTL